MNERVQISVITKILEVLFYKLGHFLYAIRWENKYFSQILKPYI